MATPVSMSIDGRRVDGDAGIFDVFDPSTGQVCASAPSCSPDQLDRAFAAARRSQPPWAADEEARRALLTSAADRLDDHVTEIAELVSLEAGKPPNWARREATGLGGRLRWFAQSSFETEVIDDDDARVEVRRRPVGVVAAITPWNFPVGLSMWKLAPALRTGNTVVLKPSPFTPLATLRMGEILADLLPPGVVNVVSGPDPLGAAMTSHPVPRKISFTGSVPTGRRVNAAGAGDLKRVTLELGGNDPAIVLADADIGSIAHSLFWSAFVNSGQACAAVKRVYVHRSRHRELVEALAATASSSTVGTPSEGAELGPLITAPQLGRVADLVDDAARRGATLATGGAAPERPGYFYEPTIVSTEDDALAIVAEEQFGPALPVLPFDDVDDAIERANATEFGLGSSVWTADSEHGLAVADRLRAGMTWINSHAVAPVYQPFGGIKSSGLGVENGRWGLESFTDVHVVRVPRR